MNERLASSPELLHVNTDIFCHLQSSLRYSSQALPVNVLLDSLLRPDGDTTSGSRCCVEWKYDPTRAVPHLVLGEAPEAGGQWADNPVAASWDIGTLSYAEQLSLPGYSIADHWEKVKGEPLPEFSRPSRTDVAGYYAAYPRMVGIGDSITTSMRANDISRSNSGGFHIASHNLYCGDLVLASGTFGVNLLPPRSLAPLSSLSSSQEPVLIIGSGFTAADLIISTPPDTRIVHIFNWDPENRPSPLKACHSSAYPEYACIYRLMKLAAVRADHSDDSRSKIRAVRKKSVSKLDSFNQRNWSETYEGFPNARVRAVQDSAVPTNDVPEDDRRWQTPRKAKIYISAPYTPTVVERDIGTFHYAIGRRGSLRYLNPALVEEMLHKSPECPETPQSQKNVRDADPWGGDSDAASEVSPPRSPLIQARSHHDSTSAVISSNTLRCKMEKDNGNGMEVAPHVFTIGSLTGDSLVRFAMGGCCVVAGKLMDNSRAKSGKSHPSISASPPYKSDSTESLHDIKDISIDGGRGTQRSSRKAPGAAHQNLGNLPSALSEVDGSGQLLGSPLDRRKPDACKNSGQLETDDGSGRWCTIS